MCGLTCEDILYQIFKKLVNAYELNVVIFVHQFNSWCNQFHTLSLSFVTRVQQLHQIFSFRRNIDVRNVARLGNLWTGDWGLVFPTETTWLYQFRKRGRYWLLIRSNWVSKSVSPLISSFKIPETVECFSVSNQLSCCLSVIQPSGSFLIRAHQNFTVFKHIKKDIGFDTTCLVF